MKNLTPEDVLKLLAKKVSPQTLNETRKNFKRGRGIVGFQSYLIKSSCWFRIRNAFARMINQLKLSRMQES